MKKKKTNKANLENKRTIFYQIGTILTLLAIFLAFEWNSTVDIEKLDYNRTDWGDIEALPPVTMPKPEVKEVKPPSFQIKIVDNDEVVIDDDLSHLISEIEGDEAVKIYDFERKEEIVDDEPVLFAQFMPSFQGKGVNSFRNYIAENVVFPQNAKETGIAGTVYATFVIDIDGSVVDVQIMRGVHPDVDNAVLQVIRNSPKWEPGINNGKYVKVKYTIPIAFKLL